MTVIALSTMYAQQPRFDDGAAFARFASVAGFDAVEISHSTPEKKVASLVAAATLPVVAVHAPAPFRLLEDGRPNSALNLASLDELERKAAVAEALRSIELATRVGASRVVVHLGHVEPPGAEGVHPLERALRQHHQSGLLGSEDARRAADELMAWRRTEAPPYLEAARQSLEQLVEAAAGGGIAVGVETRVHVHEIPLPEELAVLLAGLPHHIVGLWLDVGHVEVLARLGLVSRDRWEMLSDVQLVGVHAHDVRGLLDHRAPTNGDIDWRWIRRVAASSPLVTFEVDQREPEEAVRRARSALLPLTR